MRVGGLNRQNGIDPLTSPCVRESDTKTTPQTKKRNTTQFTQNINSIRYYRTNPTKMKATCILLLSTLIPTAAFVSPAPLSRSSATSLSAQKSRTEFLRDAAGLGIAAASALASGVALPAFADEITPSGVSIKVTKSGTGPAPTVGELAAIRFSAYQGQTKIDDIFDTPEPYFTRVGSGGLIKGVEEVLPKMRVGDRWVLTIPVSVWHQCLSVGSCQ
jgi:hypothetical protein